MICREQMFCSTRRGWARLQSAVLRILLSDQWYHHFPYYYYAFDQSYLGLNWDNAVYSAAIEPLRGDDTCLPSN
jgi:hypothetical protein